MRRKDRERSFRKGKRAARHASFPPDPLDKDSWYTGAKDKAYDVLHRDSFSAADSFDLFHEDPWQAPFLLQDGVFNWEEQQPSPPESKDSFFPMNGNQDLPPPFAPIADRFNEKNQVSNLPQQHKAWRWMLLSSLLVITACLTLIYLFYRPEGQLKKDLEAMAAPSLMQGIVVNQVPLGGLSLSDAISRLSGDGKNDGSGLRITLQVDQQTFHITNKEIPQEQSLSAILDQAYAIGRQSFPWGLGAGRTPFSLRVLHAQRTARDHAYFYTGVRYDQKDVRAVADSIARQVSKPAINAVIREFDYNSKEFSVTQDITGRELKPEAVYHALIQALDSGQSETVLTLFSAPILPKVTSTDLKNRFMLLAAFSTRTDRNQDRNHNISLAARAINNWTLMPGESFSFNQATGERTLEKGYRGAPAIIGGQLIDDTGGGVCQASTTLFNAAALAGMTILQRNAHAWPVSYVDKGLDATVNWPNLDFQFRNDKDTPVFITAAYQDRQITVSFYGMIDVPGESHMLKTQVLSVQDPPPQPQYLRNVSLPPGTQKEVKAARIGYEVDTYRIFLRNGQEYRREKLFTSTYRMVEQVIEFN